MNVSQLVIRPSVDARVLLPRHHTDPCPLTAPNRTNDVDIDRIDYTDPSLATDPTSTSTTWPRTSRCTGSHDTGW